MKRRGRPRRRAPHRKRSPLRNGALVVGLLVALFMLADRGGLDRLLRGDGPADSAQSGSPDAIPESDRFTGHVTRIVDGDTFWMSGQDVRIRIWALDAPETDEPGGDTATAELTRLLSDHELTCRQRDIDRYGRIVGQCFLPDGRDITAAMIESGTATEYCFFSDNHYGTC